MRYAFHLIIALIICVLPAIASAEMVESTCIARVSTDPSLGIHNTAPAMAGGMGMGMMGGEFGAEMGMGGGYGGGSTGRAAAVMNNSVLIDLIHSYPVSGRAAREVFGTVLSELNGELDVNIYQSTGSVAMIGLAINVDVPGPEGEQSDASVLADKFLSKTLENLNDVLQRMDEQVREANIQPITKAEEQLHQAKAKVEALRDQMRQLREQAGTAALSLDEVLGQQQHLESDLLDMQMELNVSQTMRERLSQRIAEKTSEVEHRAQDDETMKALQELLELKKAALGRMAKLVESGQASTMDLDNVKAEVAEQMVRLAERREQLAQSLSDGLLANLNNRLNDVLQDTDRLQARLQAYEIQLDQMKEKGLLELAEQYQNAAQQLHEVERQARYHTELLMKLKTQAESMIKPQVIIVE